MLANKGYGVAGHSQRYSRGILTHNWNEDRFGEETVGARGFAAKPMTETTEARSHFIKPTKMDDKQVRHFPAEKPSAFKAREMAAHLLFAHGPDIDLDADKADRYASMTQTLHTLKGIKPAEVIKPSRPGAQEAAVAHAKRTGKLALKARKDAAERSSSSFVTTTGSTMRLKNAGTRIMSHAGASTGVVDVSTSKGRTQEFTRTFKSGVLGLRM